MIILQSSILGTLSILLSLGMLARSAVADSAQIDVTPSSQNPQTAEVRQVEFTLKADSDQTSSALIQQAELLAQGFIEQGFAQNPCPKRISVKILAERDGQEIPLLFSEVSRSDWQKQPNIQHWSKDFSTSAVLLGFLKPSLQQSASPGVADTSNQPSASPGVADTFKQPSASPGAADTSRAIGVISNHAPVGFR